MPFSAKMYCSILPYFQFSLLCLDPFTNIIPPLQKFLQNVEKKFLLCKIFAKFLQILDLHTDFRPPEESAMFIK